MEPSLEEIMAMAESGEYTVCPIRRRLTKGDMTPMGAISRLMRVSKHCYMLESAEEDKTWGRYSILGYDPKLSLSCTDGKMLIGDLEIETDSPAKYIRQVLAKYRSPRIDGFPPFTGGLVGYFSYDYLKYSEPALRMEAEDTEGFQDVDLMLFDQAIVFDNQENCIDLIANVDLSDPETSYNKAVMDLEQTGRLLLGGKPVANTGGRLKGEFKPMFDHDRFCSMIEKAKEHIRDGDIFQIVLSNRLEAEFDGSLLGTYKLLRETNPSPYMFYFSGTDVEVAGASPETLVKLENGVLHTFPLAGTRRRGKDADEDRRLEEELLSDEKELAEHNMLVDLGRNDIGRIAEFGSVEVERYHTIQRFSHVMHIGSTVRGKLRQGLDALDVVDAILPAGTLSGAPKIRACQLIDELEDNKRGIYGGAVGYIDFSGNLDTAIGIRLAYKKNGKVFVRSGAGIVADSVPESEFNECIKKAEAVVSALRSAGGEML